MSSIWRDYHRPIITAVGVGALAAALYSKFSTTDAVPAATPDRKEKQLPLPRRCTKANPSLNVEAMKKKQVLEDVDLKGKRVLIRVDYNVPVKDGVITDTRRIDETMATIKYVLSCNVKCIVLIAHLGRPYKNYDPKNYTLEPCIKVLQKHLPATEVVFVKECVGPVAEAAVNNCAPGTVLLMENLRFHIEEADEGVETKEADRAAPEAVEKFKQGLSRLGDVFVFEAFGAAHRPHASVVGIDLKQRVAGKLMAKEMEVYSNVLGSAQRPFVAIIGGAKVSDKVAVIKNLMDQCDEMIIGGGMAYTFKKIIGKMEIGKSLFEEKAAGMVEEIMKLAEEKGVKIHLPVDHIIADGIKGPNIKTGVTDDEMGIPKGWMGLDVGPRTRAINSKIIAEAKTVLWNGPLGVYEEAPFAAGTLSAMWDMAQATKRKTMTIIGGGDTGAACAQFFCGSTTIDGHISHVSTGGGSSLVLMEGKMLPAIVALSDKEEPAKKEAPKKETPTPASTDASAKKPASTPASR